MRSTIIKEHMRAGHIVHKHARKLPLKFYSMRDKKAFTTENYNIKKKSGRTFAIAKGPSGNDCYRVMPNIVKSDMSFREKELLQEELTKDSQMRGFTADPKVNETWDTPSLARRLALNNSPIKIKSSVSRRSYPKSLNEFTGEEEW
jgi:hypothetical protein